MTSISAAGGMLQHPGTALWGTRWLDRVMDMPYRTGKPHIWRRDGAWRTTTKTMTRHARDWADLTANWEHYA